jgi:hypothetical protein
VLIACYCLRCISCCTRCLDASATASIVATASVKVPFHKVRRLNKIAQKTWLQLLLLGENMAMKDWVLTPFTFLAKGISFTCVPFLFFVYWCYYILQTFFWSIIYMCIYVGSGNTLIWLWTYNVLMLGLSIPFRLPLFVHMDLVPYFFLLEQYNALGIGTFSL